MNESANGSFVFSLSGIFIFKVIVYCNAITHTKAHTHIHTVAFMKDNNERNVANERTEGEIKVFVSLKITNHTHIESNTHIHTHIHIPSLLLISTAWRSRMMTGTNFPPRCCSRVPRFLFGRPALRHSGSSLIIAGDGRGVPRGSVTSREDPRSASRKGRDDLRSSGPF